MPSSLPALLLPTYDGALAPGVPPAELRDLRRDLNPAECVDKMHELHRHGADHSAHVLDGLIRGADRAGVVPGPEVEALFDAGRCAQGHLVAFTARRRQHLSLVVTAFAGEEKGVLTTAHQIEANLMHGLA